MAHDQSGRYANLDLKEDDLIAGGQHFLVAYRMKPAEGHGFLAVAAHVAAESSTGTNFESFPGDADKLFPGWREQLGIKAA